MDWTRTSVTSFLRERGVSLNRSLGQNYLVDGNFLEALVRDAEVGPGDTVVEIGSGLGNLTERLAARAARVVAFEVDAYGTNSDPNGWSVLARGIAHEITAPAELAAARALPLESWAWDGGADRFVRIELTVLTGRRVREAPATG